uniref:Nucleoprotein n=1 Tax=Blatta orientalis phasmavirus 1 TaxID=3133445 RepID=A0AAT9JN07_9VIRU
MASLTGDTMKLALKGLKIRSPGDEHPTSGLSIIYWNYFPMIDSHGAISFRPAQDFTLGPNPQPKGLTYSCEVTDEWSVSNAKRALRQLKEGQLVEYEGQLKSHGVLKNYISSGLSHGEMVEFICYLFDSITPETPFGYLNYVEALKSAGVTDDRLVDMQVYMNLDVQGDEATRVHHQARSIVPRQLPTGSPVELPGSSGQQVGEDSPEDWRRGYEEEQDSLKKQGVQQSVIDTMATGEVGDVSADAVKLFVKIEEYQGFDPVMTVAQMMKCAESARYIQPVEFKKDLGTMSYHDIEDEDPDKASKRVKNDARWLIALFSMRGVNFENQRQKMEKSAADLNGNLLSRYKIPRRPGTIRVMGPEVITLPRVAAAFAADTCRLQTKGLIKPIVPYETLLDQGQKVPMCLFGTQFPALIPEDESIYGYAQLLVDLSLWVAWKFDDRIKADNKKRKTTIDQMQSYLSAARANKIYSDKARVFFLKGLGVLGKDGRLMPEVERVCEKAQKLWLEYSERKDTDRGLQSSQSDMEELKDMFRQMFAEREASAPEPGDDAED